MVVIVHQMRVVGFLCASTLYPSTASLHHVCFLEVEMTLDDSLEALRWVLQLSEHGELDVSVAHDV